MSKEIKIQPTDQRLKEFGFLPGGYAWGNCKTCGKQLEWVAKYTINCFKCASAKLIAKLKDSDSKSATPEQSSAVGEAKTGNESLLGWFRSVERYLFNTSEPQALRLAQTAWPHIEAAFLNLPRLQAIEKAARDVVSGWDKWDTDLRCPPPRKWVRATKQLSEFFDTTPTEKGGAE